MSESTEPTFTSEIPVSLISSMGDDAAVIAAARVSTQGDRSLGALASDPAEAEGLINFLMKNRHGTPFEHNAMTFYVKAPIFVFREFHRHRIGWSYNEESGRYKQLDPEFYVPAPDRNLVQVGKPGAYEFHPGTEDQQAVLDFSLRTTSRGAYALYEAALDAGVAKEVARMALPVNIFSSMYATCNARSLMAFLSLRTHHPEAAFPSKPMREIEIVAEQMEETLKRLFPLTYNAYVTNGRVAP